MPESVRIALDVFSLLFLGAGALSALLSPGSAGLGQRVASVLLLLLVGLAVVSCSSRQAPIRESSEDRCVDMVQTYCEKLAACFEIPADVCRKNDVDCARVRGITQSEAEACTKAMREQPCGSAVPIECQGIAEPIPEPRGVSL